MPRTNRIPVLKDCAIPDCPEVAMTKGLCRKHYQAMKKAEKKQRKEIETQRQIILALSTPRS